VLIPGLPLLKLIVWSQVANGILLPFVVIYMLLLVNRPRLMGAYRNKRWQNAIALLTAVTMIVISTVMVFTIITGQS
jgi:Mn2+/Fe2+ NRAMP family transporter